MVVFNHESWYTINQKIKVYKVSRNLYHEVFISYSEASLPRFISLSVKQASMS